MAQSELSSRTFEDTGLARRRRLFIAAPFNIRAIIEARISRRGVFSTFGYEIAPLTGVRTCESSEMPFRIREFSVIAYGQT